MDVILVHYLLVIHPRRLEPWLQGVVIPWLHLWRIHELMPRLRTDLGVVEIECSRPGLAGLPYSDAAVRRKALRVEYSRCARRREWRLEQPGSSRKHGKPSGRTSLPRVSSGVTVLTVEKLEAIV